MVFSNDTIRHIWKVRKKKEGGMGKTELTYIPYTIYKSQHKMYHKRKTSKTAEILDENAREKPFQPWFRYIFLGIQNAWNIQEQLTSSCIVGLKAKGYRHFGRTLAVSCTFNHILTIGPRHPASKYSCKRMENTHPHKDLYTKDYRQS